MNGERFTSGVHNSSSKLKTGHKLRKQAIYRIVTDCQFLEIMT